MWQPPNKHQLANREKWFALMEDPSTEQHFGVLFGADEEGNSCRLTNHACGCALGLVYRALNMPLTDSYETGLTYNARLQLGFGVRYPESDVFLKIPYEGSNLFGPTKYWSVMAMNDVAHLSLPEIAAHLRKQPVGSWHGLKSYAYN